MGFLHFFSSSFSFIKSFCRLNFAQDMEQWYNNKPSYRILPANVCCCILHSVFSYASYVLNSRNVAVTKTNAKTNKSEQLFMVFQSFQLQNGLNGYLQKTHTAAIVHVIQIIYRFVFCFVLFSNIFSTWIKVSLIAYTKLFKPSKFSSLIWNSCIHSCIVHTKSKT